MSVFIARLPTTTLRLALACSLHSRNEEYIWSQMRPFLPLGPINCSWRSVWPTYNGPSLLCSSQLFMVFDTKPLPPWGLREITVPSGVSLYYCSLFLTPQLFTLTLSFLSDRYSSWSCQSSLGNLESITNCLLGRYHHRVETRVPT